MGNDNLRQALTGADLQPDELAGLVGVDVRTVRRWLSGQTPYRRHRAKLAGALGLPEEVLWPEIPPAAQLQPRDLITGYPTADSIGIPTTQTLIQGARERIDLLDRTLADYLLDGVTELLIQKAQQGAQVRIIVAETGTHLTPLLDRSGIEVRVFDRGEYQAVHRYDNQMLVTLPLTGEHDEQSPLIHIQRRAEGGLFDRLAAHYDESWAYAEPLHSKPDSEPFAAEGEPGLGSTDESAQLGDPEPEAASAAVTESPVPSPPRRWPRRPPER